MALYQRVACRLAAWRRRLEHTTTIWSLLTRESAPTRDFLSNPRCRPIARRYGRNCTDKRILGYNGGAAAAGPRQAFRSKTTKQIATTHVATT